MVYYILNVIWEGVVGFLMNVDFLPYCFFGLFVVLVWFLGGFLGGVGGQ